MELDKYTHLWNAAKPLMSERLTAIVTLLREQLPAGMSIADPQVDEDGDEFKVFTNVHKGDILAVGLDFILVDGGLAEDADGVCVGLNVVGLSGLVLGGYTPLNWTESAWTTEVAEVVCRIQGLDVEAFVTFVLTNCLTNPTLLAEMEKAAQEAAA